jgi:hypothetical protein
MPVMIRPPMRDTHTRRRGTTVRVRKGGESVLGLLARWIEKAPLPSLSNGAWTFIARAWFFVAGATVGILLAFALIAGSGQKKLHARQPHSVVTQGTARILVIQRPTMASERGVGELAENDLDEIAPPSTSTSPSTSLSPARRSLAVGRRAAAPTAPRTPSTNAGAKDLLSAGL